MERAEALRSGGRTRRAALQLLASSGAVALLAACGAPAAAPETAKPAAAVQPTVAPTVAASAGAPSTGAARPGDGTLTVAFADLGTESMDVIGAVTNNFITLIYEPLLRYDPQGNLMPVARRQACR